MPLGLREWVSRQRDFYNSALVNKLLWEITFPFWIIGLTCNRLQHVYLIAELMRYYFYFCLSNTIILLEYFLLKPVLYSFSVGLDQCPWTCKVSWSFSWRRLYNSVILFSICACYVYNWWKLSWCGQQNYIELKFSSFKLIVLLK